MNATPLRLRILHSNDIHSHFEQMPAIAAAFKKLRAEAGEEHTLTVDIGDHLDRMRPETEASAGGFNLDMMSATGYEAMTLGNNEGLTLTREALAELYGSRPDLKMLCGNLVETETGSPPSWMAPYHIIVKSGISIGLIGVTAYYHEFYRLLGWTVQDPFASVQFWAGKLRPQVDVLVLLSHLGLKLDERIAVDIPGIDVILGGHSHHLLEQPLRIGQSLVCGAGKFGQYIGVVDLELDPVSRKPIRSSGYVRSMAEEAADPAVLELAQRCKADAASMLDREVAYLPQSLPSEWNTEAPLGNMLAAALRRWTGADIGIVNAGQFLDGLKAGPVTAGRLLEICPSPINPCRIRIKGEHLLKALEESLLPEFKEMPIYGFGFRGKVLGMLNLDGLRVEYDPKAPDMAKIRRALAGSQPLVPEKEYIVGTIDMFTFGKGYLSLAQGSQVEYFLPEFIRDIIVQELHLPEAIREGAVKRWHAV
ncbi:bifunctional metallophosphatase/5'-nucleotidase [Paenibacillus doosanensis]|uniref:Endonuclease YhcR n=1 Tax=Paenibacillus konkukensis TaxID=2020716 RepID=A0ABY4RNN2_9BACL|nr:MULTISPECIES: bifunctional UDP-sugar hydrolase/5'-nucleotidase [Paenibacillus]MCS7463648.1 bifunctional metallophosphatase/5'-nucleotidase [Paenibacillus doosanensis]UQZ83173.1 Endonuclease YhcR precursor [Paenibacillus konkukensis]